MKMAELYESDSQPPKIILVLLQDQEELVEELMNIFGYSAQGHCADYDQADGGDNIEFSGDLEDITIFAKNNQFTMEEVMAELLDSNIAGA